MSDLRFIIEYMSDLLELSQPRVNTVAAELSLVSQDAPATADDPAVMPLERLEARICSLAGHLTAATCQFLLLVAGFDAREGWAGWQLPSCAAWLSWKCQLAPGTAREQVRVARALAALPLTCGEFAAGRLSYAKVRALTRIATPEAPREDEDVSAETPSPASPPAQAPFARLRHPAYPNRCHLEDGPAISPPALRLIGCNAAVSTMVHDADGNILSVGRRTRKPSPALRRAVRERDGYRCRFPGCESRRTDAHHIRYWGDGGETSLLNLISLCKAHHQIIHARQFMIASGKEGVSFYTREGTPIPASPALPQTSGDITRCHDAVITPDTIIPPHSGERLDLNLAVWVCLNNIRIKAEQRERQAPAGS